jgi:hypothetical protein
MYRVLYLCLSSFQYAASVFRRLPSLIITAKKCKFQGLTKLARHKRSRWCRYLSQAKKGDFFARRGVFPLPARHLFGGTCPLMGDPVVLISMDFARN